MTSHSNKINVAILRMDDNGVCFVVGIRCPHGVTSNTNDNETEERTVLLRLIRTWATEQASTASATSKSADSSATSQPQGELLLLSLSVEEVAFLFTTCTSTVSVQETGGNLQQRFCSARDCCAQNCAVYVHFTKQGYYLKHGSMYGANFLLYTFDTENQQEQQQHVHSIALVFVGQCYFAQIGEEKEEVNKGNEKRARNYNGTQSFLVAERRVAKSVGKKVVLACVRGNGSNEVSVMWL